MQRTPFRLLERIGARLGRAPDRVLDALLRRLADLRTEGSWVNIGSALGRRLNRQHTRALRSSRAFIIEADA